MQSAPSDRGHFCWCRDSSARAVLPLVNFELALVCAKMPACGGIEWVALCDAWDQRRDETAGRLGVPVKKHGDYRALLDQKDIDAVIVATWDHMHSRITCDACRAVDT